MPRHILLLLDKDIQAAKADTILPTVSNIVVQVVEVAPVNKVVPACTMIQIEELKALAVKAAIMNGFRNSMQMAQNTAKFVSGVDPAISAFVVLLVIIVSN